MRRSGQFKPAGQDLRRGKGGARPGAGRPSNQEQAAKKLAAERAREKMEAEVDGVMNEYLRLAKGGKIKKGSSPQTIRHCVERWLPPARQAMDLAVGSPEAFYIALAKAEKDAALARPIEPGDSETKVELLHDKSNKKTNQ
jgi:hypothetical protein